jgi:hypothetical protein
MILASNTTMPTGSVWVMMIVVVACLAAWLILVVIAAARPGAGHPEAAVGRLRGSAAKQLAEPGPNATGSDTTGPDTTGSDTAATRDDMYPVPGPRVGEAPVATPPLAWAAGATPNPPPGAEKADMDTSTDQPGVQWTARTPPQRQSDTDEGARTTPRRDA